MATISEALAMAVRHYEAGRAQAVEDICRRILAVEPEQADALHLLGAAALQGGRPEVASEYLERAVRSNPRSAQMHCNLGRVRLVLGQPEQAAACCRRALELVPGDAASHYNLGQALKALGRTDEVVACYARAIELDPRSAEAHNSLGVALRGRGEPGQAVACFQRALQLRPRFAEAYNNLGNAWRDLGKLDEAIASYGRAVELMPELNEAIGNLGVALWQQDKPREAAAWLEQALRREPDNARLHNNLGLACKDQGQLAQAIACYQRAIALAPSYAEAHSNLGSALKEQGQLDEALACYRKALELEPAFVHAHSSLLYTLNFCSDYGAEAIHEEHRRFDRQHAEPLRRQIEPHANDRTPHRRLRIGYVSPDFRRHPVGLFLLPLLESHDHAGFEIVGYASVRVPDDVTARCRACCDLWREVLGRSDEQVAQTVRDDRIDILVDLTMHMAGNRMLLFARKPAPVQVTYLAYAGTTGLRTIDYRFTDPYLDPPGDDDRRYSEQSVRLPETYWCYRPIEEAPPPGPLPALGTGELTFGCLNNFRKVTAAVLATWGQLLLAVPRSRLLLHAERGEHRRRVRDFFASQGVAPQRVAFLDKLPLPDYFCAYQHIDIALDPFPHGGGTTTCDALWMGVPVVTLVGQTAVGRGGLSILSNLGLPEWAARDAGQYVDIAAGLAADLDRVSALRSELRQRMRSSPLMDAPRFARNVEAAYRSMWRQWCGLPGSAAGQEDPAAERS